MSARPIIDAGPALNFFSINKERILFGVLGPISTPETVEKEVLHKARTDPRFRLAENVWRKVIPRWVSVLSDDVTPELAAVVDRISGLPMAERKRQARDLGEIMVIAHAVVAAETGQSVVVLIDDGTGARLATQEINRLHRLRHQGKPVGTFTLADTLTILRRAAGTDHIPDKAAMRTVYDRLQACDDGLPPIASTGLLSRELWANRHRRP